MKDFKMNQLELINYIICEYKQELHLPLYPNDERVHSLTS